MKKDSKSWLIIIILGIFIFYMTGFGIKSPSSPTGGDTTDTTYSDEVEIKIKDTTIHVNGSEVAINNLLAKVESYQKSQVTLIDDLASNNTYTTVYNMLSDHYTILEKTTY